MPVDQTIDKRESPYLAAFEQRGPSAPGGPWLLETRQDAMGSFAALGFPTTHDEDWKFTSIAPLTKVRFHAATAAENGSHASIAELVSQLTKDADSLVFVNGRQAAGVSQRSGAVRIASLHDAYANASALIKAHLARYADYRRQAFVALNTAFLDNGAFVYIPDGT
ncbi:MAG: hypothetical protein ACRD9L_04385, partial [Bryobacteraceae bacterium]